MPDAIVVGAGASGLAAAFRLERAGFRVRVLEAGDRVGGKMWTTTRDGFTFDRGYEDLSIAREADVETAADYASRRVGREVAEYIVDSTVRGVLGTRAQDVSVLEFFFAFNNVIGSRFLHFRGGMGGYAHLRASQLGDVTLGATVLEVIERDDQVEVVWRDADGTGHVERAEGCVVAVGAHQAAEIGPLGEVEWIEVDRWPQVVAESRPGYYVRLDEFHQIRRARDRRVQLAGDYFSSSNVNTATAAGERAARELIAAQSVRKVHAAAGP